MSDKGGYAVRRVKSLRGMEGVGFNAELLRDGKPVAYVMDDANGGEYRYEWYDHKVPRVAVKGTNMMGEAFEYQGTPEEAHFVAYLNGLPWKENVCDHKKYPVSGDCFVGSIVDAFENEKRLKRICKAKTLFRVKGDKPDEYRTIKAPFTAAVKDYIVKKYGDTVEEILNERLGIAA